MASADKGRPPVVWGRFFRLFIACPGSKGISTRPGNIKEQEILGVRK